MRVPPEDGTAKQIVQAVARLRGVRLERVVTRWTAWLASSTTRRASFTAAELGKAFAMSGSSTTTFAPSFSMRL